MAQKNTNIGNFKKNGYASTFDKFMNNKEKFADKCMTFINGKDYHHFLDSKFLPLFIDVKEYAFKEMKKMFLKLQNKRKLSNEDYYTFQSLAMYKAFEYFDDAEIGSDVLDDIEYVTETYFDNNKSNFVAGLFWAYVQDNK